MKKPHPRGKNLKSQKIYHLKASDNSHPSEWEHYLSLVYAVAKDATVRTCLQISTLKVLPAPLVNHPNWRVVRGPATKWGAAQ